MTSQRRSRTYFRAPTSRRRHLGRRPERVACRSHDPEQHHVQRTDRVQPDAAPLPGSRASVIRTAGPTSSPTTSRASATRAASSATTPSRPRPRTRRPRSCCCRPSPPAPSAPARHRGVPRGAAPPGEHLRAGVDARPDLQRPGGARARHRLPALRVQGLRRRRSGSAGRRLERDDRGAAQGVDHGELPSSTASSSSSTTSQVYPPCVQRPAPADLRRRHVRGGDPAAPPGSATRGSRCRWRRCRTCATSADRYRAVVRDRTAPRPGSA